MNQVIGAVKGVIGSFTHLEELERRLDEVGAVVVADYENATSEIAPQRVVHRSVPIEGSRHVFGHGRQLGLHAVHAPLLRQEVKGIGNDGVLDVHLGSVGKRSRHRQGGPLLNRPFFDALGRGMDIHEALAVDCGNDLESRPFNELDQAG